MKYYESNEKINMYEREKKLKKKERKDRNHFNVRYDLIPEYTRKQQIHTHSIQFGPKPKIANYYYNYVLIKTSISFKQHRICGHVIKSMECKK